jgi:phosphohistidine phosphatase
MRRLHLMRHGDADSISRGGADHDRMLAARGRLAAESAGARLERSGAAPELILCSSARRAVETLAAIRSFLPAAATEYVERGLYLASEDALLERIREVGDECAAVLLVGHNPGIGRLAYGLARPAETPDFARLSRSFPTAAIAPLRFDVDRWADCVPGRAELAGFSLSNSTVDPR